MSIIFQNFPIDYFDIEVIKHQVRYLGLMENLRVRRAGFGYRNKYDSFVERYKCLCPETWPRFNGTLVQAAVRICTHFNYKLDSEYSLGKLVYKKIN